MRYVFAGAGDVTALTTDRLRDDGHEIVVIDDSRERIDELSKRLDASYLHGDVTEPDVLNEADPKRTDVLFCLTDDDQTNVIAALTARTIGSKRVVPSIADACTEIICKELKFDEYVNRLDCASEARNKL